MSDAVEGADPEVLDRLHAERVSRVPGVTLHPKAGKDHGVIRGLAISGELKEILRTAVQPPG